MLMATNVEFLDQTRAKVETSEGDTYILGYSDTMNYQIEEKWDGHYTKSVAALFDKYYQGDDAALWGPILVGMYQAKLNPFLWVIKDRDKERERIGNRIKDLRKAQGMDAKDLAQKVGIDAGNLSRIEQGKFSVGLDILNKIASVLNMKFDFVPLNELRDGQLR